MTNIHNHHHSHHHANRSHHSRSANASHHSGQQFSNHLLARRGNGDDNARRAHIRSQMSQLGNNQCQQLQSRCPCPQPQSFQQEADNNNFQPQGQTFQMPDFSANENNGQGVNSIGEILGQIQTLFAAMSGQNEQGGSLGQIVPEDLMSLLNQQAEQHLQQSQDQLSQLGLNSEQINELIPNEVIVNSEVGDLDDLATAMQQQEQALPEFIQQLAEMLGMSNDQVSQLFDQGMLPQNDTALAPLPNDIQNLIGTQNGQGDFDVTGLDELFNTMLGTNNNFLPAEEGFNDIGSNDLLAQIQNLLGSMNGQNNFDVSGLDGLLNPTQGQGQANDLYQQLVGMLGTDNNFLPVDEGFNNANSNDLLAQIQNLLGSMDGQSNFDATGLDGLYQQLVNMLDTNNNVLPMEGGFDNPIPVEGFNGIGNTTDPFILPGGGIGVPSEGGGVVEISAEQISDMLMQLTGNNFSFDDLAQLLQQPSNNTDFGSLFTGNNSYVPTNFENDSNVMNINDNSSTSTNNNASFESLFNDLDSGNLAGLFNTLNSNEFANTLNQQGDSAELEALLSQVSNMLGQS